MNRRVPAIVLALALAALALWRATCVLAGPDIDTDAYAHHMIARAVLADPRDLAVHWVWLPLFHYAQVPLVAMGGTMQEVRWFNVVVATILPVMVFAYVRRTTSRFPSTVSPDVTAAFAALVVAACPIAMQMGTTAQPEPLFALLVFGVATSFDERRAVAAATMLSAAVLLRYEAWACLVVIGAILAADWRHRENRTFRATLPVLLPAAFIIVWAALRYPVDGRWFGFLRQTREFASGASGQGGAVDRGLVRVVADLLYYPLWVAGRVMGPVLFLVPFGIARTVRQQGWRFVSVLTAGLAFVSLAWVGRSTLGLDRHFVAVVPLYAIFAAQGAATVADWVARWAASRGARARDAAWAAAVGRIVSGVLSVASLAGLVVALTVWMGHWRGSIERGFPERQAVGEYLRSLPGASTVFCDDATIEILSGLDRHRFDRHWIDDPNTWDLVRAVARAHGVAYVATWQRKLIGHEASGAVVFRSGEVDGDPGTGVGVMRVEGGLGPGATFP